MNDYNNDIDRHIDNLGPYLAGTLTDAERAGLEAALEESPELRRELQVTRLLRAGIEIVDLVMEGHPDSDEIVVFSLNRGELEASRAAEIAAHIEECKDCREEIELIGARAAGSADRRAGDTRGLMERIIQWISGSGTGRISLVGAAAAVLLVVGLSIGYLGSGTDGRVARQEISAARERASAGIDTVAIVPGTTLIELSFLIPTRPGRTYDATLLDNSGRALLTIHDLSDELPIVLGIPTGNITEGLYQVRVTEDTDPSSAGAITPPDTFYVPFEVIQK